MRLIEVAPQGSGWMVTGPGEPLFFQSGRWAEQAGRRLAAAVAASGETAELKIWDRVGGLAGALRYNPAPPLPLCPLVRTASSRPAATPRLRAGAR